MSEFNPAIHPVYIRPEHDVRIPNWAIGVSVSGTINVKGLTVKLIEGKVNCLGDIQLIVTDYETKKKYYVCYRLNNEDL